MVRTLVSTPALVALVSCAALSCDPGTPAATSPVAEPCGGFPAWESSSYVLPYGAGESYRVNQANCSGFGHSGFWKFGYDFSMEIGTPVTAARAGVVLHSMGGARDGDRTQTNLVTVAHDDGTILVYSHLTFRGALVDAGDRVEAGEVIALSGDTGLTGDLPHLHFSLHSCGALPGLPGGDESSCPTLPMNFRNTEPNALGLLPGRSYVALAVE